MLMAPPKPKLTFRVGVIGHRPNRLEQSKISPLEKQIHTLLLFIREATQCARRQEAYAQDAETVLRIVSSLAEGTDRIVARVALDLNFQLLCPMPFPKAEFERDFAPETALSPNSIEEFRQLLDRARQAGGLVQFELDGLRANAPAAYGAAGRVLLNQSDVLIAVWDGRPAAGKGGTVDTLHAALAFHIPVIWIDAHNPDRWQLMKEPKVLQQKEEERDALAEEESKKPEGQRIEPRCVPTHQPTAIDDLRTEVRNALDPHIETKATHADAHTSMHNRTTLEMFLAETKPARNWGFLWKPFRDFWGGWKLRAPSLHVRPFEDAVADDWQKDLKAEHFGEWINQQLLPYYAWADKLADLYADAYRSSFVAGFLLGAIAVFFALLGMASGWTEVNLGFLEATCVAIELLIIVFVFWLITRGLRRVWQGKWLNYRLVAELVRHIRFLAPLGGGHPFPRLSPHLGRYGDPAQTWMYWYVRAVERRVGLPSVSIDRTYLTEYAEFLTRLIEEQHDFHATSAKRAISIDNRLHTVASGLLLGTLLACILHLSAFAFGFAVYPWVPRWLILAAAVFPALGAALAAIRDQGEFHRIGMRSEAMAERLGQLNLELNALKSRSNAAGSEPYSSMTSGALAELAMQVVQLMVDEVLEWRIVFVDRPLETRA
jgi:hypothetical protein